MLELELNELQRITEKLRDENTMLTSLTYNAIIYMAENGESLDSVCDYLGCCEDDLINLGLEELIGTF